MSPGAKQFSEWLIDHDYENIKSWAARTNGTEVMCVIAEAMIHVDGTIGEQNLWDLAEEMGVV